VRLLRLGLPCQAGRRPGFRGSCALSLDEGRNGLLDADGTLSGVCAAVRKVDPARVKSLDHLYARGGILHALGTEDRFPLFARDDLSVYGRPERCGKCRGQSIRRDALRALKLDDTFAFPALLQ